MTAPSRTADEIIADWHAGRADHDPYDEIGGLVVEIGRLRTDLADAERVRQDYEDERDEARTELAATEGDLGVAIREAAAAREGRASAVQSHMRAVERHIGLGMAVMQAVADGKSLRDVLEIVGDDLNACDAVDDEGIALFERAGVAAARAEALISRAVESLCENRRSQIQCGDPRPMVVIDAILELLGTGGENMPGDIPPIAAVDAALDQQLAQ